MADRVPPHNAPDDAPDDGQRMAHAADPTADLPVWPLRLTWLGLLAARLTRAFWPVWSIAFVGLALLLLGMAEFWAPNTMRVLTLLWGAALGVALLHGLWRFRWPRWAEAQAQLDATLPGRPLQAVLDHPATGGDDPATMALWQVHQQRMAERLKQARAVPPDLRVSRQDPFALRYVALLALMVAALFGSYGRLADVPGLGGPAQAAAGPSWEGWIEPPAYTGLPTLYLADQQAEKLQVSEGSHIVLRLYGEVGQLRVRQGVDTPQPDPAAPEQTLRVARDGALEIEGPGGREWQITLLADQPPGVVITGASDTSFEGQMSLPFTARDDYGVRSGSARVALNLDRVDRRYGLALTPEAQADILRDLPLPITGSRADFSETLIDDFSKHPWAHLPVTVTLQVQDAADQTGQSEPVEMALPARRFFDPLAAAVIEQRRDLLWNRDNVQRVTEVMRAISWKPEDRLFRDEGSYLQFRTILRRLEAADRPLETALRDELAEALWALAVQLEDGDIDDALERMQRAQERLSEAMREGASEEEIAELMQELRDATQDYLRQLSRQAQQDQQNADPNQRAEGQEGMQMDMNDLQAMMDRIQELMEQGRMAEAQQALEELQQLMENMQVTQGGEGPQSPGQQSMEELGETLRQQQGLSDQAFRDLQEQFNPGANQGQSQNNEGRDGGEGRGQSHDGQNGQGQDGQGQEGQEGAAGQGQSLADRQRALRDELNRQQQNLPGAGTEAGEAAREALRRAEEAMDGAEQALRQNDLAGAIDQQAEAMDQLRDGMRNLGEALAEAQRQEEQGQGQAQGQNPAGQRDPLGRNPGSGGALGGEENLLQGEDVYRRARELLDEIRRRTGEGDRPQEELDYLKRLLERF